MKEFRCRPERCGDKRRAILMRLTKERYEGGSRSSMQNVVHVDLRAKRAGKTVAEIDHPVDGEPREIGNDRLKRRKVPVNIAQYG